MYDVGVFERLLAYGPPENPKGGGRVSKAARRGGAQHTCVGSNERRSFVTGPRKQVPACCAEDEDAKLLERAHVEVGSVPVGRVSNCMCITDWC